MVDDRAARKRSPPAPRAAIGILRALDPQPESSEKITRMERKGFWAGLLGGGDKEKWKAAKDQRYDNNDTQAAGVELERMIGYITATALEDWSVVLEICERASANEANAKVAARALRREIRYAEPKAQLAAARLWGNMLQNCSDVFIQAISERRFIDTLEVVLTSIRTSPVVRERLMEVLAAAAFIISSQSHSVRKDKDKDGIRALWRRLKPARQPDTGVPFDMNDAMFCPPVAPVLRPYPFEAPVLDPVLDSPPDSRTPVPHPQIASSSSFMPQGEQQHAIVYDPQYHNQRQDQTVTESLSDALNNDNNDTQAAGAEVQRLIGYITATASEDWSLVLEVCARASANEANAKVAAKALRREFKYAEPKAQLVAARLWGIMFRNGSDVLIQAFCKRGFVDALEDVLTSGRTSPVVCERLMEVLAAGAFIISSRSHFVRKDQDKDGILALWRRLKPVDKPEMGVPFDMNDAMFRRPVVPILRPLSPFEAPVLDAVPPPGPRTPVSHPQIASSSSSVPQGEQQYATVYKLQHHNQRQDQTESLSDALEAKDVRYRIAQLLEAYLKCVSMGPRTAADDEERRRLERELWTLTFDELPRLLKAEERDVRGGRETWEQEHDPGRRNGRSERFGDSDSGSKTQLASNGSLEDTPTDANEVIILDPPSHQTYHSETEYANNVLCSLSSTKKFPDEKIPRPRANYTSPYEVNAAIEIAIDEIFSLSPLVLIDVTTGRLCDAQERVRIFKMETLFKKLIFETAMMKRDPGDIRQSVAQYFKWMMFSHTWEGEEPTFKDINLVDSIWKLDDSPLNEKLRKFCARAREDGYKWAWSDTCCIDKDTSAVLSQSLTSMYSWYEEAAETLVYLADVLPSSELGALTRSRWMTRAWTLQELLASKVIRFYGRDWKPYLNDMHKNHKESPTIKQELANAMGVGPETITSFRPEGLGVRDKLRLASTRRAMIKEDLAISLIGIFSSDIVPRYGLGKETAIGLLLENIVARTGDVTVIAWSGKSLSFNSCLPDSLAVYNQIPYSPPLMDVTELDTCVEQLGAGLAQQDVLAFYNKFNRLPRATFSNRCLQLPCIVFPVTKIGVQELDDSRGHLYRAMVSLLDKVKFRTSDKMPLQKPRKLIFVHPWLYDLRDPLDGFESDDGRERESIISSDELGAWSIAGSDETVTSPLPAEPSARIGRYTQALRLLARVGRPFNALLLEQQSTGRYKRVAAEHKIVLPGVPYEQNPKDINLSVLEIV